MLKKLQEFTNAILNGTAFLQFQLEDVIHVYFASWKVIESIPKREGEK